MSSTEIGSIVLPLISLIAAANILGYLFTRLRQPRVIGEIAAGIILGPTILGHFWPRLESAIFHDVAPQGKETVIGFVYWLGLLFLMFASGTETRRLFSREDRSKVSWLASLGTGIPFVLTLAVVPWIPVDSLMGPAQQRTSLCLVIGIAAAVTSIPVISKIFFDLKILHTRFARLVLSVAVIEDILLWAVLAVATALAKSGVLSKQLMFEHISAALIYFGIGMTIAPRLLTRLSHARWNILAKASPMGYLVAVMFAYTAIAALLDVNLVFAAFLAGFGVASDRESFESTLQSLNQFSFAVFVAPYFAIVGYKLDLSRTFSFENLAVFLLAACTLKLLSVGLAARVAGFRGLDVLNLSVATNARGGPGIVLASVAFDTGIVNATFYTTLVLLAVLTSQAAGVWLDYVLRKGWPLLSTNREEKAQAAVEPLAA